MVKLKYNMLLNIQNHNEITIFIFQLIFVKILINIHLSNIFYATTFSHAFDTIATKREAMCSATFGTMKCLIRTKRRNKAI
jgi:hypothetical protein